MRGATISTHRRLAFLAFSLVTALGLYVQGALIGPQDEGADCVALVANGKPGLDLTSGPAPIFFSLLSSKDGPGALHASGRLLSGLNPTVQRKANSHQETALPARSPMQKRAAQKAKKPSTRGGVRRGVPMPAILSTYYEFENGRSTSSGIPFDDDKLTVAVHYPSRANLQLEYIAIEFRGKVFGLTYEDKIRVTDRFQSSYLERTMGTRYTHRLDCSPRLKFLITGERGGLTPGAKFWVIEEPKKVAK